MDDFQNGDRVRLIGDEDRVGTIYRVCKKTVFVKWDKPFTFEFEGRETQGGQKGSYGKDVVEAIQKEAKVACLCRECPPLCASCQREIDEARKEAQEKVVRERKHRDDLKARARAWIETTRKELEG